MSSCSMRIQLAVRSPQTTPVTVDHTAHATEWLAHAFPRQHKAGDPIATCCKFRKVDESTSRHASSHPHGVINEKLEAELLPACCTASPRQFSHIDLALRSSPLQTGSAVVAHVSIHQHIVLWPLTLQCPAHSSSLLGSCCFGLGLPFGFRCLLRGGVCLISDHT